MTPAEFKAWFDGFTEAFTGCPTKAQWGRIKERVSEIDGKAVTERICHELSWPCRVCFFRRISVIPSANPGASPVRPIAAAMTSGARQSGSIRRNLRAQTAHPGLPPSGLPVLSIGGFDAGRIPVSS